MKKLGLNDVFTFGKYSGYSVLDVGIISISYLEYANEIINPDLFKDEVLNYFNLTRYVKLIKNKKSKKNKGEHILNIKY